MPGPRFARNFATGLDGSEGWSNSTATSPNRRLTISAPSAVTDATFQVEVEQHKGLAVVDFWATWCGPCHMVAPIMDQLAGKYNGKVKIVKLDIDTNQATAMRFNVRSIPSILFFKDGRHVDTIVGAFPSLAFEQKIEQHLS